MSISTFKPYVADLGSGIPHHGSNVEPDNLQDASGVAHVGFSGIEARLLKIAKALSRVGMNQIAEEINNEAQDLGWYSDVINRAVGRDLDQRVHDASKNSKAMMEAVLAGHKLAKSSGETPSSG